MNNKTLKKLMIHFLDECQKFINLRDRKRANLSLTDEEEKAFANAKNVIAQYGSMIKGLNLSSKEVSDAVLSGLADLMSMDNVNHFVKRPLTVGEAIDILSQFLCPEEVLNNDENIKKSAVEVVRQSHRTVILAKYSEIHKNHKKVAEQKEKFQKLVDEFNDTYINKEIVELSMAFASDYFNINEIDEFEQPVDASFVTALVLGKEYDEDEEMEKNSVSLGRKAVSGAGNDGDEAGE